MRRVLHISIMIAFSVTVVAAVVFAVGFEETKKAVAAAGWKPYVSVGALTLAFLFLQALVWTVLNRPIGHRIPFLTLFEGTVVGMAGNILTPSTFLGGEPLKVAYVARSARLPLHQVAGSVLLSKYLEGISFILFFGASAFVAAVSYRDVLFGSYLAVGVTLVVVATLMVVAGVWLYVALIRRWRPLTVLMNLLGRIAFLARRLRKLRVRTRDMEDQVSRVFCEEPGEARFVFGAQLVAQVTTFAKPALFFYYLGAGLEFDLGQLCLLFVVGQVLLAFQLTPSGAGVLDGGLIGAFALMGYARQEDQALCVAYLLCLRLWDIIIIGAGSILGGRVGARLVAPTTNPNTDANSENTSETEQANQ